MIIRYIFGGTFDLICYAFYSGLIVVQQKMIDDVNRQLPPSERIGIVIASTTIPKVIRLHRQFYPSSNLTARFYRYWWGSVVAFVAALACVIHFVHR
jgi:hypothetical protein